MAAGALARLATYGRSGQPVGLPGGLARLDGPRQHETSCSQVMPTRATVEATDGGRNQDEANRLLIARRSRARGRCAKGRVRNRSKDRSRAERICRLGRPADQDQEVAATCPCRATRRPELALVRRRSGGHPARKASRLPPLLVLDHEAGRRIVRLGVPASRRWLRQLDSGLSTLPDDTVKRSSGIRCAPHVSGSPNPACIVLAKRRARLSRRRERPRAAPG